MPIKNRVHTRSTFFILATVSFKFSVLISLTSTASDTVCNKGSESSAMSKTTGTYAEDSILYISTAMSANDIPYK